MSSGVAAAREGIVHEASIYASDSELWEAAAPFLTHGLDAQDPTYVVLNPHGEGLVRREFGEPDGLHYVPASEAYVNPARTVARYLDVVTRAVADGADQVRFITEVPHPGLGSAWDWWGRYEAAVNEIFADLPVWALCTYDERTTPSTVLDEVRRSHPFLTRPGAGRAPNDEYQAPSTFLAQRSCAYADPLEAGEPLVELTDPSLPDARRVAAGVTRTLFGPGTADNMALAVSEIVTNSQRYGRSPVELRMWAGPDRVIATIKDRGTGIRDATIGLTPVDVDQDGGRGIWIASQLCDHLSMTRSPDGFVIRLVVGTPSVTV